MAFDYILNSYKTWRLRTSFSELVSQMDEERLFGEKLSIRESGRCLKKYGSTCNHVRNTEILIRHEIDTNDTLQGIALKYGCTTEQIRRANRLFASDSLFLRQSLMIPVERDSPYYPKNERPHLLLTSPQHSNNNNDLNSVAQSLGTADESTQSIDNFLREIDTSIAASKKYVAKQKNSEFMYSQSDDVIFLVDGGNQNRSSSEHMPSSSSNSQQQSQNQLHHQMRHSSSGSSSIAADTQHLILGPPLNQRRRVQNSLQRLEQQQDEFFEL